MLTFELWLEPDSTCQKACSSAAIWGSGCSHGLADRADRGPYQDYGKHFAVNKGKSQKSQEMACITVCTPSVAAHSKDGLQAQLQYEHQQAQPCYCPPQTLRGQLVSAGCTSVRLVHIQGSGHGKYTLQGLCF